MAELPFEITARVASKSSAVFIASVEGQQITSETIRFGSGSGRRRVAKIWAANERLHNRAPLKTEDVDAYMAKRFPKGRPKTKRKRKRALPRAMKFPK